MYIVDKDAVIVVGVVLVFVVVWCATILGEIEIGGIVLGLGRSMFTYDLNIYDLITYDHIRISYMLNTYETIYACHI